MPHDFTAQDAELDALGSVPADVERLAVEFAGGVPRDLAAVDRLLDQLGVVPEGLRSVLEPVVPREASPRDRSKTETAGAESALPRRDPQSGEIALGDQEGSGEAVPSASLQPGDPAAAAGDVSGSFQLPGAAPDDGAADDPAGAMQAALSSQVPADSDRRGEPSEASSSQAESAPAGVPEDSLTAAMVSDFEPPEVTQIVPTESRAPVAPVDVDFDIEEPRTHKDQADDEFDALFEGLTSASDAPPPEDGETGLVTQSRPISRVREEQQAAVQAYVPDVPDAAAEDFDDGEATKAFSAAALDAAQGSADASISDSLVEDIDLEELDSGELELVLDEDASSAEQDGDDDSPDDGGDNKPGGLLGRFLGRKK